MLIYLKKLKEDQVFFGTAVVTAGMLFGSIFNYALQFFLGRAFTLAEFGTFNSLLSLANIVLVPAGVLALSIIKLVTELKAQNSFDVLTNLLHKMTLIALGVGFLTFALVFGARNAIAHYFNITDSAAVSMFGIYMGVSFLLIAPSAYLQGLLRFKGFSFHSTFSGFLRLFITALFVILGYGVAGAYAGISVAVFASFLTALLILKKNLHTYSPTPLWPYFRRILVFSVPVLLIRISMTSLNNIDLVIVKHFFDHDVAGLYASLVTVGKILLFGTGLIATVMYPIIADAYAKKEDYMPKFWKFLWVQVVLVVAGVGIFMLLPALITVVMFGQSYLPSAEFLPRFSIFVGFYVLVNFLSMFLLAIEKTSVALVLVLGGIIQLVLLNVYNTSIVGVININIAVTALLLLVMCAYLLKVPKYD